MKKWIEQNQYIKLPSKSSKVGEVERKLGKKLSYIRQDLISKYMKLQTEQEPNCLEKNTMKLMKLCL